LLLIVVVAAVLFIGRPAESQQLRIGENLRHEKILLPPTVPDKSRLVAIDYEALMEDDIGIGIMVFYDDVQTKREVDYVEFYAVTGDLLLVSWIDGFGIRQIAMDRGLLDQEGPAPKRIFVLITGGISL
ncbi:MAG: hypothetical protein ABW172_06500, partial [Candidatus Binatia bacterium]